MLEITSPAQQTVGLSDDKPIVLDGVKSADFARLLWMFYNPWVLLTSRLT
jgi:hypothetical protein